MEFTLHAFAVYVLMCAGVEESSTADLGVMTVEKTRNTIYPLSGGYAYYTIGHVQHPLPHYPLGWPFKLDRELTTPPKPIREQSYLQDRPSAGPPRPPPTQETVLKHEEGPRVVDEPLPQWVDEEIRTIDATDWLDQLYERKAADETDVYYTTRNFAENGPRNHLDVDAPEGRQFETWRSGNVEVATYPNYEKQMFYAQLQHHFNQLLQKAELIEQLVQANRRQRAAKSADEEQTNQQSNESKSERSQRTEKPATTTKPTEDDSAVLPEIYDLFLNSGGGNSP